MCPPNRMRNTRSNFEVKRNLPRGSEPITPFYGTTDPPVFFCSACGAVRVNKRGDRCVPCLAILATRHREAFQRDLGARGLVRFAAITIVLVAVAVVVAILVAK